MGTAPGPWFTSPGKCGLPDNEKRHLVEVADVIDLSGAVPRPVACSAHTSLPGAPGGAPPAGSSGSTAADSMALGGVSQQARDKAVAEVCGAVAKALGVSLDQVNVKAKTAEKLGPVGQGQSMEAHAVVLLQRA